MFEYLGKDRSEIGGIDTGSKSMTKKEFQAECDINNIMAKYLSSGVFPENVKVAKYGDFSEAGDFRESLHIVSNAREQFAGLPSKVRDRFQNDPAAFLEFVQRKENFEEARSLGLLSDEAIKNYDKSVSDAAAARKAEIEAAVAAELAKKK